MERSSRLASCWELARVFLWLGLTSLGGPAAYVASMERELVERRRWLDREEFLDLLGLTQLLPGSSSTELTLTIGQRRAGTAGLLVAGACFVLPTTLLMGVLAHGYLRFRGLPQVDGSFRLLRSAVLAVVTDALLRLWPSAARQPRLAAILGCAAAASLLGVGELPVMLLGGAVALGSFRGVAGFTAAPLLSAATISPSIAGLFAFFLQVGSVLYGSDYVLLAFLQNGLVEERGWLTEIQLLDAISVSQLTPGPMCTTATFVGYLIGGIPGALAATAGILTPTFVLVALVGTLLRVLLLRPWFRPFLDGVNAAALGLLMAVVIRLGEASWKEPLQVTVGLISLIVLTRWQLNSAWVMGGAALLGWLLR
ncbi:MAG: chromate efflux transporter [Myxococcales bacterium]|nr:chromate efflux transporter [Polyangiaceae bacterium]MDW8248198.1 chromate efflux transporter [Myxococcales bacterium]